MSSQLSDRDKRLLRAGGETIPGTKKYEGGVFANGVNNDFVILSVVEPATDKVITTKRLDPLTLNQKPICAYIHP